MAMTSVSVLLLGAGMGDRLHTGGLLGTVLDDSAADHIGASFPLD